MGIAGGRPELNSQDAREPLRACAYLQLLVGGGDFVSLRRRSE